MHTFSVFLFFSSVWICFVMFLFCFVLFFLLLIFQADTSSILFHLVVENLILHIFLIIMIIIPCSGMFRNVPCSRFYRRPIGYGLHRKIPKKKKIMKSPNESICLFPLSPRTSVLIVYYSNSARKWIFFCQSGYLIITLVITSCKENLLV